MLWDAGLGSESSGWPSNKGSQSDAMWLNNLGRLRNRGTRRSRSAALNPWQVEKLKKWKASLRPQPKDVQSIWRFQQQKSQSKSLRQKLAEEHTRILVSNCFNMFQYVSICFNMFQSRALSSSLQILSSSLSSFYSRKCSTICPPLWMFGICGILFLQGAKGSAWPWCGAQRLRRGARTGWRTSPSCAVSKTADLDRSGVNVFSTYSPYVFSFSWNVSISGKNTMFQCCFCWQAARPRVCAIVLAQEGDIHVSEIEPDFGRADSASATLRERVRMNKA